MELKGGRTGESRKLSRKVSALTVFVEQLGSKLYYYGEPSFNTGVAWKGGRAQRATGRGI